jgi:hypothetical protein
LPPNGGTRRRISQAASGGGQARPPSCRPECLHELLLECFEDWYLELRGESDAFLDSEEPRTLAEIIEAEQEFFDRVWYVRDFVCYGERT